MAKYRVDAIVRFEVPSTSFDNAEKTVIERIDDKMGANTGLTWRLVTSISLKYPEKEA